MNAVDVSADRVEKINRKISPIRDEYIEKYLAERELELTATLDGERAYSEADFVIIAVPTNYDPEENFFDCSAVETVIEQDCITAIRFMTCQGKRSVRILQ